MFCSSRLGLKMALELRGLPVLFSLLISLPFWDALCCFKNSTQVSCLGNQVRILHWRWKAPSGRATDAVYLSARMRSESHAILRIRHLKGVAPPVNAVSSLCHVSAPLTTHTSPWPQEHQWQQLSVFEPRAQSSWQNHETNYTHNIWWCSICRWRVCVNGLEWLINISIFNPVTWMWIHKFARLNSNQGKNTHAIAIPKCCHACIRLWNILSVCLCGHHVRFQVVNQWHRFLVLFPQVWLRPVLIQVYMSSGRWDQNKKKTKEKKNLKENIYISVRVTWHFDGQRHWSHCWRCHSGIQTANLILFSWWQSC